MNKVRRYSIVTDSLDIRAHYVLAADYDALALRILELERSVGEQVVRTLAKAWSDVRARRELDDCLSRGIAEAEAERDALRAALTMPTDHPDTRRLQWIADKMRLTCGHRETGNYQLPRLIEWVESGRDACALDDLRAALDSNPEVI